MKISPIPQGQGGLPSQNLKATTNERTATSEKLELAKAISRGESLIRVSPSDTPIDPQVKRAQESIRRLKMNTNASPGGREYAAEESAAVEHPVEEPKSANPDESDTNGTAEETKPLSPQFAALAKQRRALQVKERELADREKALTRSSTNGDLTARLKSEPLSVLQEAGVTYDQLTEAIIAEQNGISPEIQKLRNELKSLKEGLDKNFSDRDTQAEQAVLTEMRKEAHILATKDDSFEMVRETQSLPEVIDLIHRTFKQTGEILDVSEAMSLVEEDLLNESLKIANLKKVQGKLNPPTIPSTPQQQQQFKTMKTLTNRDSASVPLDRKARAIAAMNGTLRK